LFQEASTAPSLPVTHSEVAAECSPACGSEIPREITQIFVINTNDKSERDLSIIGPYSPHDHNTSMLVGLVFLCLLGGAFATDDASLGTPRVSIFILFY
jgi:hypothetical protein